MAGSGTIVGIVVVVIVVVIIIVILLLVFNSSSTSTSNSIITRSSVTELDNSRNIQKLNEKSNITKAPINIPLTGTIALDFTPTNFTSPNTGLSISLTEFSFINAGTVNIKKIKMQMQLYITDVAACNNGPYPPNLTGYASIAAIEYLVPTDSRGLKREGIDIDEVDQTLFEIGQNPPLKPLENFTQLVAIDYSYLINTYGATNVLVIMRVISPSIAEFDEITSVTEAYFCLPAADLVKI